MLHKTLTSMTQLDREGLIIELVIINNNSNDNTPQVVESFQGQLPITFLSQPQPGKNCALNMALNNIELGKLVVFTDDDVSPKPNWLQAIRQVSTQNPNYSIFGGKIYSIWPEKNPPSWTDDKFIQGWAFSVHDLSDTETQYDTQTHPFGANFWVRREVFANNRRFDEQIGPRPGQFIMGSELSFLRSLRQDGYKILYTPKAIIGHYAQKSQLSSKYIRTRAYRYGRSLVHFQKLPRQKLFDKSNILWYTLYLIIFLKTTLTLSIATLTINANKRLKNTAHRLIQFGYIRETIKKATAIYTHPS